jgi:hypothetical protein
MLIDGGCETSREHTIQRGAGPDRWPGAEKDRVLYTCDVAEGDRFPIAAVGEASVQPSQPHGVVRFDLRASATHEGIIRNAGTTIPQQISTQNRHVRKVRTATNAAGTYPPLALIVVVSVEAMGSVSEFHDGARQIWVPHAMAILIHQEATIERRSIRALGGDDVASGKAGSTLPGKGPHLMEHALQLQGQAPIFITPKGARRIIH